MRRLIESTLVSLDGVIEAPERWASFDAEDAALSMGELGNYDAFVMGRVTYENFFANWGHVAGNPYIDLINAMPKYVASRSLTETTWNATLLGPDPSGAFVLVPAQRQESVAMASATISASITIKAPAEAIFAVLIDPAKHAAIDGTGWVRDPLDRQPLTASGQIFRMGMYHANHPNGNYEMANRVQALDPPHAISWEPGHDPGDGNLRFGGWIWRYDLAPLGPSETEVRLSYDWSAVPEGVRQQGQFPPFSPDHLDNSLTRLAELVVA